MSNANQSWRINVLLNNLGSVAIPTVGNRGATVIRASKGPVVPKLIAKGGEQRILNIYGKPSASYPDVWDAIEYNRKADLWISAPSKNGLYSGVLVTKTGTVALTSGQSSTTLTFTAIPIEESVGTGDACTVSFTKTLTDKTYYVNQSIDILLNGTSINVSATNAATEVLTTTPDVGSGTYVRSTGVLSFTFTSAPADNATIEVSYDTNRAADAYFALFSGAPQADDLAVKVTNTSGVFTINAYQIDADGNYNALPNSPYSVSMTSGAKDGFGKNIYINDVFTNDDFIIANLNTALTFSTFVDDVANVDFNGGSRGAAITITELTTGWNYFQSSNTYPADIFWDSTAVAGIPALFVTLRTTYQMYSHYILPLPNASSSSAISTKSSYSVSNRGISFYWNWAKVQDTYNNSYFYSPLIGRVAGKHADMVDVFNGLAPSWVDENNHGGQLGSGIISMVFDPSETELEDLDTASINPIIFDNTYGVMIVSDKTSLTTLSDYSFIPHSRVADYCISNIISQALVFQLTKLNDATHRAIVKSKIESIINPLLRAPYNLLSPIPGVPTCVCDDTNNTATTLSQRKFIVNVYIRFTPTSETINLIFTNVGFNTTVQLA